MHFHVLKGCMRFDMFSFFILKSTVCFDFTDKKDPFVKLNCAPVCFGTHNSAFSSFNASTGGNLMKIKLVHLYGYVTCKAGHDNLWSPWGCGYYLDQNGITDYTGVSLTTASNTILFPPSQIVRNDNWSLIPGYSSRSPELVMSIYDTPVTVSAGQEWRLWYTEDLTNTHEDDDAGRVCAVFGYFM